MSQSDETHSGDAHPAARFSTFDFLLKLVLLPGLVVLLLVAIFVVFGWLTLAPGDVDSLVDALARDGNTRWRAAVSLAGVLREPGNEELKSDPVLAGRLIEILERELEAGGVSDGQITMRMYLCRALGEFRIPDPLPVLVEAAKTERDASEVDVRRSAIEAIALLASNLDAGKLPSRPGVLSVLLEASEEERPPVRSAAAFALGVIGGSEAETGLATLLVDEYPDVRYNAATGLARQGSSRGVEVLLEMLDPNESAGIDVEKQEPARDFKRAMILQNALRATRRLAAANPTADLARLAQAVERLLQSDVDERTRVEAVQVLDDLKARSARAEE